MLSYNKIVIKTFGGEMGRKFSEYSGDKKTREKRDFPDKKEVKEPDETTIHKKVSKEREENITEKYKEYSQMDSDRLLSEFLRMSRQRISDGSLDALEIQRIQETLFPHISSEQQKKFQELIDLIEK